MIPDNIARILPPEGQDFYKKQFTASYLRTQDEHVASIVAWAATKACMREVDGQLIACSEDFIPVKLYEFALEPADTVIIKNHDNGDIELDAVLATTEPRKTDGARFTEEALAELANQINEEGSTFPDVDHALLSQLQERYGNNYEAIVAAIKREKGVFRTIKAAVRDGKLWIKAFLDKRYHNYVNRFKHLSIEALAKPTKNNQLVQPRYLGFTFTDTPQLSGARIVV